MKQILLTESEAAEAMRLSARTLREARKAGELHYVLFGRAVRYTIEDLESFVAARTKVNSPCPAATTLTKRSSRRRTTAQIIPFHLRKGAAGRERL